MFQFIGLRSHLAALTIFTAVVIASSDSARAGLAILPAGPQPACTKAVTVYRTFRVPQSTVLKSHAECGRVVYIRKTVFQEMLVPVTTYVIVNE